MEGEEVRGRHAGMVCVRERDLHLFTDCCKIRFGGMERD